MIFWSIIAILVSVNITYLAIVIVVILVSMTLHEAMHAYASYWLGDDTAKLQGRLSLNPLKHIDPFLSLLLPIMLALIGAPIFGGARPVPFNPNNVRYEEWGVAIVALAGPLTNLILAFVAFGLWVILGAPSEGFASLLLGAAVSVNLGFFVFNLIPIPPLDGSRVMYALAPEFVRRGMEFLEQFSVTFVFVLVLFAGSALGVFMSSAINFIIDIFSRIFML